MADYAPRPLTEALAILDVIDGIVDDTHPEGDGCALCRALDDLRATLDAARAPRSDVDVDATRDAQHDEEVEWAAPRSDEPEHCPECSGGLYCPGIRRSRLQPHA